MNELPSLVVHDIDGILFCVSSVLGSLPTAKNNSDAGVDAALSAEAVAGEVVGLGATALLRAVDSYVIHTRNGGAHHTELSWKLLHYTRQYCVTMITHYATKYCVHNCTQVQLGTEFSERGAGTVGEDVWDSVYTSLGTPFAVTCPAVLYDVYIRTCIDVKDVHGIELFLRFLLQVVENSQPYAIPQWQPSTLTLLFTAIPILANYDTCNTVAGMLQVLHCTSLAESLAHLPLFTAGVRATVDTRALYVCGYPRDPIPSATANTFQDNVNKLCRIL
uniref:DNA ligase 2 n=1 Tax=Lygus hesperus TaxID=30085 RepID=A0A0A9XL82_LYGHE